MYGHLERIEKVWSGRYGTLKVSDSFPSVQPRRKWNEVIRNDLKEIKVSKDIAKDRNVWKSFIRNCPIRGDDDIKP